MPTEYLENLGTPSGLIATNVSGTASALIANTVTTNANLSGAITSVGNVTSLGSFTSAQLAAAITDETGTSKIVFSDSPQLAGIVNISNLTASTIISADASKNVVSLALATYPSLTELSYVKGVTSGIQAQIAAIPVNPSQTGNADKVLATNGSASSWQYAGLGAGSLGTGNVVLGREWPSAFTTGTDVILIGKTATASNGCTDSVIIGQAATAGASPYATIVGDGGSAAHSGVAIGRNAAVAGSYSVAVGHGASGGSGAQTVAIGMNASCAGSDSVAIGYGSVAQQNALAIGREANAGATFGMAIGRGSSYTGANSHAMGYGTAAGSGTNGVFIGYGSGLSTASGNNNTVVGADSFNGAGLTTAHDNVIIGKGSGKSITSAFTNCLISTGSIALTTGDGNCIIGDMAASLATGQLNTAIGFKSTGGGLSSGASQYSSVAIGTRITCGSNSVAVGDVAVASGGTVTVGNSAGNGVTAGVCIGNSSGGYGASNITVVGTGAVARGSTGHGVSIGFGSGGPNLNTDVGGYNTCIGAYTGNQLNNPTAASNVFLGYSAGRNNTTQGSTFFLDNQDRTTYAGQQTGSLMYGTFNATASSQTLAINAKVGINIAAPVVPLQVEVTALVNSSALTNANNSVIRFDESTGTIGPRPGITWLNSNSGAKVIAAIESVVQGGFAGELQFSTYNSSATATQKHLSLLYDNSVQLARSSGANLSWATEGAGNIGTSSSAGRPKDVNLTGQISIGTTSATNSQFSADNANYFVAITDTGGIGGRKGILWRGTGSTILAGIQPTVAGGYATDLDFYTYSGSASAMALRISAAGAIKAIIGDVTIETAGKGLKIKEGSNARMGVATLVLGTVTVSNTSVTANTRIMLTAQNNSGTIGWLSVSARTASTSFTILSSSALDTSDVAWMLVEPA